MAQREWHIFTISAERKRLAGRIATRVLFAATPWLTLGFATPIAFLAVAARSKGQGQIRALILWISTGFYASALIVEIAYSDAAPGTTRELIWTACFIAVMVIAGIQAIVFAIAFWPPARRSAPTLADPSAAGSVERSNFRRLGSSTQRTAPTQESSNWDTSPFLLAVLLVLGGFLIFKGIGEQQISADLERRGVPAAATVVKVDHDSYNGASWTDVTVKYVDATGKKRRAVHEGREDTKVGDRFQIVYDPRDPSHVHWKGDSDQAVIPLVSGLISVVAALGMGSFPLVRTILRIRGRRERVPRVAHRQ